jgi:hypothetical protein
MKMSVLVARESVVKAGRSIMEADQVPEAASDTLNPSLL